MGVGFFCLLWTLLMIDCRHDTMQVSNTTHHGRVPRLILPGTFTVDVTVDVTDRWGRGVSISGLSLFSLIYSEVCLHCEIGLFKELGYSVCVCMWCVWVVMGRR